MPALCRRVSIRFHAFAFTEIFGFLIVFVYRTISAHHLCLNSNVWLVLNVCIVSCGTCSFFSFLLLFCSICWNQVLRQRTTQRSFAWSLCICAIYSSALASMDIHASMEFGCDFDWYCSMHVYWLCLCIVAWQRTLLKSPIACVRVLLMFFRFLVARSGWQSSHVSAHVLVLVPFSALS